MRPTMFADCALGVFAVVLAIAFGFTATEKSELWTSGFSMGCALMFFTSAIRTKILVTQVEKAIKEAEEQE